MPAVSVIMPVYNRAESVTRAIDSVLAQDFHDFELMIVDDASTDATVSVIEACADPRVTLLRQPENRGGGGARNRGIREAHGDIVSFLDSDDVFLPHKLSFVVEFFRAHPEIDVLFDSYETVYPPERHKPNVRRINPALDDTRAIAEGIYARRISKATPALSARRQALLAVGLFDESLRRRQDFDLAMRLTKSCRCATTDRVLWTKYWTGDSITAQTSTFMNALLEMCRRDPTYLKQPEYRIGAARDLARHAIRLVSRRQFGPLGRDLQRFSAEHGSGETLALLGRGLIENARRKVAGVR
jgi:glycosyltransferase involved in cell wall biosynthesis